MPQPANSLPKRRLLKRKLKACPLCETLNVKSASECYVCGWRGAFETSEASIDRGLIALGERSPEIVRALASASNPVQKRFSIRPFLRTLLRQFDRRV